MKSLNIFKKQDIGSVYFINPEKIIPIGMNIGKCMVGKKADESGRNFVRDQSIDILEVQFLVTMPKDGKYRYSEELIDVKRFNKKEFILKVLYFAEDFDDISIFKSHPLYVSNYISKSIDELYSESSIFSTDMQFFVNGSSHVIQQNPERLGIGNIHMFGIESNNQYPSVLDICLNNEQFIYMSTIHNSIINYDFDNINYDLHKRIVSGNTPPDNDFIKVFETKEIKEFVPLANNGYYMNISVMDRDRHSYNLHISTRLVDEFTDKELKKLHKYTKKRYKNNLDRFEVKVKDGEYHEVAIAPSYINGMNYVNHMIDIYESYYNIHSRYCNDDDRLIVELGYTSRDLYNSIMKNANYDSSEVIFVLAETNDGDKQLFYFEDRATFSLLTEIKKFIARNYKKVII